MTGVQEELLDEVMDLEDLASRGQQHKACPYYATRHALPAADVVLLPYSSLLTQVRPASAPSSQLSQPSVICHPCALLALSASTYLLLPCMPL